MQNPDKHKEHQLTKYVLYSLLQLPTMRREIIVESEVGKGTTCTIILLVKENPPKPKKPDPSYNLLSLTTVTMWQNAVFT